MTSHSTLSKVPSVTLLFWLIKILATTLGETGGDAVSMSLGLGYLTSTVIFICLVVVLVLLQIHHQRFNPYLYWAVIISTTTLGTTLADFVDRSLGIGYLGGSSILLVCLLTSLVVWFYFDKSLSVAQIQGKRSEGCYWITIIFSQTLGTALGDWTADTIGLGFSKGSLLFGLIILALGLLYQLTQLSRVFLFWSAFVLTRPFGAVVGDYLDKPLSNGGLALDRIQLSSALILSILFIITLQSKGKTIIGLYNNKH
ncbi:MAG: hypothetical protein B7Z60_06970 [Ferrovum sp. 37-45-19]|uniref:COG4705 family protein n=1 Tax=Ferrovum sp. JA12 TaxID=1356299 RepID=UPI000703922D|nr:hypothetical protein [Ferrovum sp. JA12]OYV78757.1 MAG: hypothetical protein B7Z65_08875 [Ferrovum sp. 21-44-67]OYV93937.1 MAG: hypothetical protein B7Z60_06970 [Ferrovum sp. 37-45-19]OZB31995.1 MAG: hypothetical protein B7X47_07690 [Ferrovum sp. 34-44-207]HQT81995.1 hypothetical protein [Ferrovaceae bacterium]KRH78978.1 hypothetical protein FERRO_00390 [Ferrovum sp. JA12]